MAVQTQGPNLFEFVYEDTKITYVPGRVRRRAAAELQRPDGPPHASRATRSRPSRARAGSRSRVTLDRVSHLRTITLTVFVPDLELDGDDEQSFHTVGIHATHRRSMTRRRRRRADVRAAGVRRASRGSSSSAPPRRRSCCDGRGPRRYQACTVWQCGHCTEVDTGGLEEEAAAAGVDGAVVRSAGVAHAALGGVHRLGPRRGLRARCAGAGRRASRRGCGGLFDGHRGHGSIGKDSAARQRFLSRTDISPLARSCARRRRPAFRAARGCDT